MSVSSPPIGIESPTTGDGRGGVHPPEIGGGGGRGPGDGFPDYERRLQRARLGLILAIVSIATLFVTMTAVFFLRQSTMVLDPQTHAYLSKWLPVRLPVRLLLFNTAMLLISSLTMELARRSVAREMVLAPVRAIVGVTSEWQYRAPWLAITVTLGLLFLFGQGMAWQVFQSEGFRVSMAGPSPFFYVLTAAHAAHLVVGIGVLIYAAIISLLQRAIEQQRIVVEVTRWYWHFMGALWVYVFALLQIKARA